MSSTFEEWYSKQFYAIADLIPSATKDLVKSAWIAGHENAALVCEQRLIAKPIGDGELLMNDEQRGSAAAIREQGSK